MNFTEWANVVQSGRIIDMTIFMIIFLIALWGIGLVEGDCTAALIFTLFGVGVIVEKISSKGSGENGGRKII